MTLRGTTGEFALDVVLRLLAETKKTGELSIRGTGGEGALGFAQGRVVTAVFANEAPIPALGAIFQITNAEFEFTPWTDAPAANLEGDLPDNLRKAEEYRQWMASVRQVIPNDGVRFRLSERAAEQGAVTFTSERWRVVLAVNGQRDVNDLRAHLHLERDPALTTLAGLVRDGVIETIEAPAPAASVVEPPPAPFVSMAAPPFAEVAPPPAPEPAPAPQIKESDWSAAVVRERAPEPAPAPAAPPPAPEPVSAWEPLAPAERAPEPVAPAPTDWGAPAPEPARMPEAAPPVSQEWGAPAPEPAPVPEIAPQDWSTPAPVEAVPPPPLDDRLAALFGPTGIAPAAPPPEAEPAAEQWTAPAATDQWTAPAPAAPVADAWGSPTGGPTAADPRLGALTATPPPAPAAQAPAPPSSEWGPPPELGAAQPKKKGMFGRFRKEDAAPPSAGQAAEAEASASSRAGLLAAFSNALLSEYNSGQYGKAHVEDRIPNLLMRVDEQADPIDKPLPVVDDRLDVQALERVALPETQAVPYLALLVSTIYGDAEKAFGRDKAKRGYRAAQQRVFAGDTSALGGSDLAGKLPKI